MISSRSTFGRSPPHIESVDSAIREADQERQKIHEYLSSPDTYRDGTEKVDVITTHGAKIYLGKRDVFKIKLPVKYEYMDFSTLELRHKACRREIDINQLTAPQIYVDLTAITRESDGSLAIGGSGEAIEWAVRMVRFPESDVLERVAERGELNPQLAARLGKQIALYHLDLTALRCQDGAPRIREIIDELNEAFDKLCRGSSRVRAAEFRNRSAELFSAIAPLLDRRANFGMVRRCHGDLHLHNIVLLGGEPTLFDALEFSERFATTDVLYDLAFLVMDMMHAGLLEEANTTFNRYIYHAWSLVEREGFFVIPLFLALRAAIRAMVEKQAEPKDEQWAGHHGLEAEFYLTEALRILEPQQPVLVAVGGLSGSGKSTLAQNLAPILGMPPGAFLLRSDLERKKMLGAEELDQLSPDAYSKIASRHVYERLFDKARIALNQGWPVIIDAAFVDPAMCRLVRKLGKKTGAAFHGLWLDAPAQTLINRVRNRRGDASDADVEVVQGQLRECAGQATGNGANWTRIDAAGMPQETFVRARHILEPSSHLHASTAFGSFHGH